MNNNCRKEITTNDAHVAIKNMIDLVAYNISKEVARNIQIPNSSDDDRLMNTKELAKYLHCAESKVNEQYICQTGFPYIQSKDGGHKKFRKSDVNQWITENVLYYA